MLHRQHRAALGSCCPGKETTATHAPKARAWMMPLNVAATSVKLEMPPPTMSARPRPSAPAVATSSIVFAYAYVSCARGRAVRRAASNL